MDNILLINSRYIEIQCDKDDFKTISKAEELPCVHRNRQGNKFRVSARHIERVLQDFRGIGPDGFDALPPNIKEIVDTQRQIEDGLADLLENGHKEPRGWLFAHQQLGREIARIRDRYAFFFDTRAGKTPMSLQIIADDIKKHPDNKWLVLCPLVLMQDAWVEDIDKFFPELTYTVLHAKSKKERLARFLENSNIYIMNIEAFIGFENEISKLGVEGVFVDESSTMKAHNSKFSKAAVKYSLGVPRWYLLSGTPAPNGEHEYYRQLQSIDFYSVQQSWTQFKNAYFYNTSYQPQYEKLVLKNECKEELNSILRAHTMYVELTDVMETPGRDFIDYKFKMPPEVLKHYNSMRKGLYVQLTEDSEAILSHNASVAAMKLNQITSGFIMDTANGTTEMLSDFRVRELMGILAKHKDDQVLIWAHFRAEFTAIKEVLGSNCAIINGTVDYEEKQQAIKDFKSGKVQYLVANPASADKGLTLTNAHICVYYSMSHSWELFKQSSDRIYGGVHSQPRRCTYYIMQAEGSSDETMYKAVMHKKNTSQVVLDALKGGDLCYE